MKERTRTGLEIIQVAVVLGILGDILLRVTPWGLNVLAFNVAFAGAMLFLLRRHAPERLTAQTLSLFGAMVFFASMFVWRDSIDLRVADTTAILAVLSALFIPRMRIGARFAGVFHYVAAFLWSSINAIGAPFVLIFGDVEWGNIPHEGWRKHTFSAVRGLAIAAPLILIFGGLFVAADAAYEGLVQRVFNFNPQTVFTHILLFGVFAWLSAGYLRGAMIFPIEIITPKSGPDTSVVPDSESKVDRVRAESGEYPVSLGDHTVVEHLNISDPPNGTESNDTEKPSLTPAESSSEERQWSWASIDNSIMPPAFRLGTVEIGIILVLVNLLFLSFVIVQVPYLFGGMDFVQNTPDFKLAEYARRGFGELVVVAGLVLPMLLASHWLIRKEERFAGQLFRVLAGLQIGLLFVIMASAVQRLWLLTGNLGYGMTTIRLYPLIFMFWLAVVFVWFGATVLRGARQYFAWGALWSAFFILGATHVLNPDEFIVRTNIALMHEGREFDASYNSQLSDDALPVLFEAIPDMNEDDRGTVILRLASHYCRKRLDNDPRSWNFSRWNSMRLLETHHEFADIMGTCGPNGLDFYR